MSAKIHSLNDFLALLKGVKRLRDGQYSALCPGHHDTNRTGYLLRYANPTLKERYSK